MRDGTSILDALAPGEMTGLDAGKTVEFCGKTFHVVGFIGHGDGAVMLLSSKLETLGAASIVSRCLNAAANVLVMAVDWTKVTPMAICSIGIETFTGHFFAVHQKHAENEATKGKPS